MYTFLSLVSFLFPGIYNKKIYIIFALGAKTKYPSEYRSGTPKFAKLGL